jgi:hypothetical protein
MRLRSLATSLVLAAALAGRAEPPLEPIVLIVSAEWPGPDAIDLPTLRRVYLDRQGQVGGARARALHMPSGSPIRESFSHTVLRRSGARLERYWIEQALLGEGLPPRELASADAVLRRVRAAPDTIGYVAGGDLERLRPEGVRILAIASDGRALLPGDEAYPLHFRPVPSPAPRGDGTPLGKGGADP